MNFNQEISLFADQLCVFKTFLGHLDVCSSPFDHPHELHLADLPHLQLHLGQGEARCVQPLQVLAKPEVKICSITLALALASSASSFGCFLELLTVKPVLLQLS